MNEPFLKKLWQSYHHKPQAQTLWDKLQFNFAGLKISSLLKRVQSGPNITQIRR